MERLSSVTLHPFGKGDLTSTGVQYSDEVTDSTGAWTTVESVTITVPIEAGRSTEPIVEVEFGLTYSIKSSSTSKHVKHKCQARDSGGAWVDLYAEQTRTSDASADREYTFSGRFETVTNFDIVDFDLQFMIKREDSGENALGKTKNSSYVTVIYSDN